MSEPSPSGALAGLQILEATGPGSTPLGRIAVAFTGMLALRMGASVRRATPPEGEALAAYPPRLPDGSSALPPFLLAGKQAVAGGAPPDAQTFLVTDDAALAEAWPGARKVLVQGSFEAGARPQSELTAMAASGLLDIVGDKGRQPLPLPGYQMAYASGLAALTGLLANAYAQADGRAAERTDVATVEVASWLNWKNRLPSVSGGRQTGLDRPEEWRAVRCRDGFLAIIFRDRDIPDLARLVGSDRLLSPDFAREAARVRNLDEFHAIVAHQLAGRAKDEVLREAKALNLQISAVLSPAEVFTDNQMQDREFFQPHGALRVPRLPLVRRSAA